MNIAELFVRVRGDVTDVTRQLKGVEQSMGGVERASGRLDTGFKSAHFSSGKLRQELVTLVRQATGTAPVVAQLGSVIAEFATRGPMVLGVIAGVAAIAVAYGKITEGARKARADIDKLIKSLVDQAKATYDATVAGQELIKLQAEVELQNAQRAKGIGIRSIVGGILGRPGLDPADAAALSKRIADAQTAVGQATVNVGKAWEAANKPVKETAGHVATVVGKYNELRDAAARVNAEVTKENRDWWKGYIDRTNEALTLTEQLNNEIMAARPDLLEVFKGMVTTPIPAVDISDSVRIANDQAKQINEAAEKHSDELRSAIWGSALQGASIIVNALNIGGGGRGSGLGGALGSTAGFAVGFGLGGPIGGAIGTTVGQVFGSLIGGLFDHKKAVDSNTRAVSGLTQAMLLYAPAGFRSESYRYNASDPRPLDRMGRYIRANASRGGANPLITP